MECERFLFPGLPKRKPWARISQRFQRNEGRRGHGGARDRLHFRLRAESAPHPAATRIENAVALTPNHVKDLSMLRFGRVDDGTMEFKAAPRGRNADAAVAQHG
jgi:hypothetical protein